jgi:enterochelin esterase family protein
MRFFTILFRFFYLFSLTLVICTATLSSLSCQPKGEAEPNQPKPLPVLRSDYETYHEFKIALNAVCSYPNANTRADLLKHFWDTLKLKGQIPFRLGDSVALMYRGQATQVRWAGDFNSWSGVALGYLGTRQGDTDLYLCEQVYPSDARLDYKIVVDGSWILDPANPFQQMSGFGPNSELRMPNWQQDVYTLEQTALPKGTLSSNQLILSVTTNLGYTVAYRAYTPSGFNQGDTLPVLYMTDGHEYAHQQQGAMVTVLDNLIHQQKIQRLIVVFIDPRVPPSGTNRRFTEYIRNPKFLSFVADELVPQIDSLYHTRRSASHRGIGGTSLGGWNAAYFGLNRSDVFGKLLVHSPAFDAQMAVDYQQATQLPLKIFMSTGAINDTQVRARQMRDVMQAKGYPLRYIEVNQGHSWGNWRALLNEPLEYLFPFQ